MIKPKTTIFHDGETLNIVLENCGEYEKEMAEFIGTMIWEYMKTVSPACIDMNAFKKDNDFVISIRNSNTAFENYIKEITESFEFADVKEVYPLKETVKEEVHDYRFTAGKYKGKTPKEVIQEDSNEGMRYLQKSIICATNIPEYMEEEIRKQLRASAHRNLSKIRDAKAFITSKQNYCARFLSQYLLILPNQKLIELLNLPQDTSLKKINETVQMMNYEEKCNLSAFIIEEFTKKKTKERNK